MAVRLEVRQPHYSSISLMPEILKNVLPHLDLTADPILRSDGLMIHSNQSQVDRENSGPMTSMIYMRPCDDGAFRIDIGAKRPWISSKLPVVAFDDVGVDQLHRILSEKHLPRLAETLRASKATGNKVGALDIDDLRKLYSVTDDEMASLLPAIKQWKAQGVPQQPIQSAAMSPLLPMSE